jgi:hypothetical protein
MIFSMREPSDRERADFKWRMANATAGRRFDAAQRLTRLFDQEAMVTRIDPLHQFSPQWQAEIRSAIEEWDSVK